MCLRRDWERPPGFQRLLAHPHARLGSGTGRLHRGLGVGTLPRLPRRGSEAGFAVSGPRAHPGPPRAAWDAPTSARRVRRRAGARPGARLRNAGGKVPVRASIADATRLRHDRWASRCRSPDVRRLVWSGRLPQRSGASGRPDTHPETPVAAGCGTAVPRIDRTLRRVRPPRRGRLRPSGPRHRRRDPLHEARPGGRHPGAEKHRSGRSVGGGGMAWLRLARRLLNRKKLLPTADDATSGPRRPARRRSLKPCIRPRPRSRILRNRNAARSGRQALKRKIETAITA